MQQKNENLIRAVDKFGTPLYVYDSEVLKKNYNTLKSVVTNKIDIFYSLKANPNIALASEFRKLGSGVELCSFFEIDAAIRAGFDPNNIIFVGPAKSSQEISRCIDLNIYAIICESKSEFKLISSIAKLKGVVARVALRINPSHISKTALLKMGGKPSQFGMDEEELFSNKKFFLSDPNIKLTGIHIYNGTRILDYDTFIENTKYIFTLATKISKEWNISFEMADIGGGIGIPYFSNEEEFDVKKCAQSFIPIIEEYSNKHPKTRIILESGRYLVGNCGAMVSRIVDIKHSKGENFLITDGGTNCNMAAVGVGSLVKRNFPISLIRLTKDKKNPIKKYNITGPLCTPNDLVGKQVELEEASVGDLIVIQRVGAYGPTASPVMFLSHGFPAEVLLKNNNDLLIRKRFTSEDFLKNQVILEET